jgi:hypothetical protein
MVAAALVCNKLDSGPITGANNGCPSYTHKEDVQTGNPGDLPEGYFVFDRDSIPGLYKSPLRSFTSSLIPNTKNNFPRSISISNDGRWIFFVDFGSGIPYLIRANGCDKTKVPTTGVPAGEFYPGGFYRNSPYGNELFYLAGAREIHAIGVTFTSGSPVFGVDRTIARLQALCLDPLFTTQYAVCGDRIFGQVNPMVNDSTVIARTGFLTIPEGGTGTATDADVYKWADDDYHYIEGCGHTMSFDGSYALANAGPFFYTYGCIPTGHKGFYITPFRRKNDPPLNLYTEHILKFGTSINWCPERYRNGDGDFWGWYFTNDNRYVAGRMLSIDWNSGGWIIDWRNNRWTMVTPADSTIKIQQIAAAIGSVDTGRLYIDTSCHNDDTSSNPGGINYDPQYKIISPNGGEIFHQSRPCTVKVASVKPGNAILSLFLNAGLDEVPLSIAQTIHPPKDSIFIFVIPDSFDIYGQKVSSISSACKIKIADYSFGTKYFDESDDIFQIAP